MVCRLKFLRTRRNRYCLNVHPIFHIDGKHPFRNTKGKHGSRRFFFADITEQKISAGSTCTTTLITIE